MNKTSQKFWGWIDASLAERSDWIKQLDAISEHSSKYPLKNIIAFDTWLRKLTNKTSEKLFHNPILDDFTEFDLDYHRFGCFVILLGSETYERVMNDPSILVKKNYLKAYKNSNQAYQNLLNMPDYSFYSRTHEHIRDYFDNPKAIKVLQKEADKNHDNRYDH